MTQRIFDVENEKDMADLWDILPDSINHIHKYGNNGLWDDVAKQGYLIINIEWHNKNTLSRPIQEATKADIGKLCAFWNIEKLYFGELCNIEDTDTGKYYEMSAPIAGNISFFHCRRLTKQEIEELI